MPVDVDIRLVLAGAIAVLAAYLVVLVVRLSRLRAPRGGTLDAAGPAVVAVETGATPKDNVRPPSVATAKESTPGPVISAAAPKPPPVRVAPVHEKAAALARAGCDAGAIARQCGITQSEAELVCWLAKNRESP